MAQVAHGLGGYFGDELEFGPLGAFGLRMKVWWSRDRLTRALARGAGSVASRELALRAGQITARRTREVVVGSIHDLLERADRMTPVLTSQVPIDRRKVRAARLEFLALAEQIRSAQPVRAQGMALALLLLTNTEGPLFGVATAGELSRTIIEATERLHAPSSEELR
jgi:hypothetical protein